MNIFIILGNRLFGACYTQGTFVCRWGRGNHPHAGCGGLGHGCSSYKTPSGDSPETAGSFKMSLAHNSGRMCQKNTVPFRYYSSSTQGLKETKFTPSLIGFKSPQRGVSSSPMKCN